MKELFTRGLILLVSLTLIFAMAGCGGSDTPAPSGSAPGTSVQVEANDGEKWPGNSFIPAGIEYDEGGKMVVVAAITDGAVENVNVFIDDADKGDFDAYVARLESKGLTGEIEDFDGVAFIYHAQTEGFYITVEYTDEKQTTLNKDFEDVEYNLYISMGNNPA